ncbi:MAG: hypothetical protein P4L92_18780 [Rudaea sp.]|nr:hypothetical protein [Rudaea sp.]
MDFAIALIGAAAALIAGLALLCLILEDAARVPSVAPATPPEVVRVSCAPDGVAITSLDRLHFAVTMLDRMINTGLALDGKRIDMAQTIAEADAFAAQQASPDTTLAQLNRCDDALLSRYPHGYWMLSSALVRESASRHGVRPR